MFRACCVYYVAAVCLAPSRPNDTHRVANWVTVPVAWDGAADNGQDGGAERWSALGSWPERRISWASGCPFVSQAQLLNLDLGSTQIMSADGEAGPWVCRPGPAAAPGGIQRGVALASHTKATAPRSSNPPGIASVRDRAKREAPALRTGQISLTYLWCCGL